MAYENISEKIIGCVYQVYNKIGFGFLESLCEKCLLIKLRRTNLKCESQKSISVTYGNEVVADIVVENTVIVELKSVRSIIKSHEVQLVNYLVATGKPVGLIINFPEKRVEVKRKQRELN